MLIGFTSELDREFFEKLITVKDVGPMVAARSLAAPVGEIAAAIARQDEGYLRRLPGIGPQKAKNIVAQLQAKVAKFALAKGEATSPEPAAAVAPDEEALRGHGLRHPGEAARLPAERGGPDHHRRARPPARRDDSRGAARRDLPWRPKGLTWTGA